MGEELYWGNLELKLFVEGSHKLNPGVNKEALKELELKFNIQFPQYYKHHFYP